MISRKLALHTAKRMREMTFAGDSNNVMATELQQLIARQPAEASPAAPANEVLAALRAILPYAESRAEDMLETADEAEHRVKLSPSARPLGSYKNLTEIARDARSDADKAVAAVDAAKALLASLDAGG